METDSFFYQLFQQLPQTLFELLGLPASRARAYRFDSVEVKKGFRIDGLFLPKRRKLPLYFVEVQFQRVQTFYANLFAKVFSYLDENDPTQDWVAVAIFPTRKEEPRHLEPYEDLLRSPRVKRVYLEDIGSKSDQPVGLGLMQLLFASETESQRLVPRVVQQAKSDFGDSDLQARLVELLERLLMSRFPGASLEEMRMKFKLHDIRKSKAWQELQSEAKAAGQAEGRAEGRAEGQATEREEIVRKCLARGMTEKQIAELLEISLAEVRRLVNGNAR